MKKKVLAGMVGMFAFAAMGGMSSVALAGDSSASEIEHDRAFLAQPYVDVAHDSSDYQMAREKATSGHDRMSAYDSEISKAELSKGYVDEGFTSADFQNASEQSAVLAKAK